MSRPRPLLSQTLGLALVASLMPACAATPASVSTPSRGAQQDAGDAMLSKFERDRAAILAMAGSYEVSFDFRETVALAKNYVLAEPKLSRAKEIVRVLHDEGDAISLQHILLAGGPKQMVIKHWRQDWVYEPSEIFRYLGRNQWRRADIPKRERRGAWAQRVYQVDDSPRYAAVGKWEHEPGLSSWTPPRAWRPLPRRDATTRDDYHVIAGVNRHVITPDGWVHEQDNTKLAFDEKCESVCPLAREQGVNIYLRSSAFDVQPADEYWAHTQDYWAEVRKVWRDLLRSDEGVALTMQGEPEELYGPLLKLAGQVEQGEVEPAAAASEAARIIHMHTMSIAQARGPRPAAAAGAASY